MHLVYQHNTSAWNVYQSTSIVATWWLDFLIDENAQLDVFGRQARRQTWEQELSGRSDIEERQHNGENRFPDTMRLFYKQNETYKLILHPIFVYFQRSKLKETCNLFLSFAYMWACQRPRKENAESAWKRWTQTW